MLKKHDHLMFRNARKTKLEARGVHMTRISKFPDAKSGEKKLVGRCMNYIFAAGRAFDHINDLR